MEITAEKLEHKLLANMDNDMKLFDLFEEAINALDEDVGIDCINKQSDSYLTKNSGSIRESENKLGNRQ